MILLHGASLGSSGDVFERNMQPLAAAGLRVIAPDRPGYGGSEGPGDRTNAGHRRFIIGFLDALSIDRALLVGHSQQGGVAAQVALDHPDRVPRVVVLGGGGVLPPVEGDEGEPEGERLESEPTPEWTAAQLRENLHNHALITPEAVAVRHRMSLGAPFTYYSAPRAPRPAGGGGARPAEEPVWKRVGEQPDRFLLLFGRQDKPTTEWRCELMRQHFPNVRLVVLDGCRHLVQWDRADDFVRETIAFAQSGAAVA
jgi:4,5:9,10-diseco-3-hydroxy-5,9,17-trioxoandrosta-1(10),2-diene-4-oate hydrolase